MIGYTEPMATESSEKGLSERRRGVLDATTRKARSVREQIVSSGTPGLTILCHPDSRRVGEQATLTESLSRLEPEFVKPIDGKQRPLSDPYLSRQPLRFRTDSGGIEVAPAGSGTRLEIDGREVSSPHRIDRERLENGVTLLLGDRIVLLLHLQLPSAQRPARHEGLIGESAAMLYVRKDIQRVADLDLPVLLRGESGTGKELVARAIHDHGRRRGRFIPVNVGAIPSELAEAELFGATKGAYTGAEHQRTGFFREANGGTLFLDEIGDTPAAVQPKLLRALESGDVQPLGVSAAHRIEVDVRLISATDVDLEQAIRDDRFRLSLFQRLAGYSIELPPLRARREDIGLLFFHFLQEELKKIGQVWRLELNDPGDESWVPAELVARLTRFSWPGNVRELRNTACQLAVFSRGEDRMLVPDQIARLLDRPETVQQVSESIASSVYRHPDEVGEEELLAALREHRWIKRQAAAALNVSRTSLDSLMKKCKKIRRAADLSGEEIDVALRRCDGDLDAAAAALEVSKRALVLRMRSLGMRRT